MKNWILSLACLFVIGSQVCLGAEKRIESKNPMLRVKTGAPVKKHSNKGRKPTPHAKAGFFRKLKSFDPAMAQLLVDINPAVENEPAEKMEAEKPRVALFASAVKPVVEKDSLAPLRDELAESIAKVAAEQRNSLTPLQESLLAIDLEVNAVAEADRSPVSPMRDKSPSMWRDVVAARERAQTNVFATDLQEKADEFKQQLEDVHSKHVARTRSRTAVSE